MPETFSSQPLFAMSIVMGLIFDDRLRRQRFRIHLSHVIPSRNLEQDVTAGSVGTFDRIVVKNGATLTLIDKHAVFLLTVEANLDNPRGYSPLFFSLASVVTRTGSSAAWKAIDLTAGYGEQLAASGPCRSVSCPQNQDCQRSSGFQEEAAAVIDINKMAFLLGKTPAECAESPYPSEFPPSLIRATGIKLSKRDI